MRSPISTWSPTSTTRSRTTPACGATRACSIFIASTAGEALAGLDGVAVLDRERDHAPVHRRPDRGVAFFRAALGPGERIDELDERLPASRESVSAAIRLVQRDLIPRSWVALSPKSALAPR